MGQEQKSARNIMAAAAQVAATKGIVDPLDLNKRFSFGKQADTLNMVDEHAKAIQLNWRITNKTSDTHTIAIGCLLGDTAPNMTQFATLSDVKKATGATAVLKDGIIIDGTDGADLTATSTDTYRKMDEFLRYTGVTCTRIVGLSMVSRNATNGNGDSSNYDLKIRSIWVNPLQDQPEVKELNLRPLVPTGANFTESRLNVNFIRQNHPFVMTNEHWNTIQINPNTELMLTVYVGAQFSKAQDFWRSIKASDDIIRPGLINSAI